MLDMLIMATSSSDQNPGWFILGAGLLLALGHYLWVVKRYRNAGERDRFERETAVAVANVQVHDHRVGQRTKTEDRSIDNQNSGSPTYRVGRR